MGEEGRDVWSFSFPCTPSTCVSVTISLSIHNVIPFLFLLHPNTATGTATTTAPRRVRSLISYDVLTIYMMLTAIYNYVMSIVAI